MHHGHAKAASSIYLAGCQSIVTFQPFSSTVNPWVQATQDLTHMNSSNNSLLLCLSLPQSSSFFMPPVPSHLRDWCEAGTSLPSLILSELLTSPLLPYIHFGAYTFSPADCWYSYFLLNSIFLSLPPTSSVAQNGSDCYQMPRQIAYTHYKNNEDLFIKLICF